MADEIQRDNPYGEPDQAKAAPSAPGTLQVPEQQAIGNRIGPLAAQQIGNAGVPPSTAPLSPVGYQKSLINSAEERKYLTGARAEVEGGGYQNESTINKMAAAELGQNLGDSQQYLGKAMADAQARSDALRQQIAESHARQLQVGELKAGPHEWWNAKSTSGKVQSAIGLILGGIAGGMNKTGRNVALEMMNKAIDDDMAVKKFNIGAKAESDKYNISNEIDNNWKKISETHQLDDTDFNRELHRQTWMQNYRIASLEKVKLQLAENAASTNSQLVRQNALVGIQDLDDAQKKAQAQIGMLGAQAAAYQAAKIEKLSKEYSDKRQELIKEGSTPDEADRALDSDRRFDALKYVGLGSDVANARVVLQGQAQADMAAKVKAGIPQDQAAQQIQADPKYALLFNRQGPVVPKATPGAETQEQLLNRTVLINGVPKQAVNAKAATDWKEYTDARAEAVRLLGVMKASQPSTLYGPGGGSGDPASYEAARAKMVEILPKIYGFNRGPSLSQVKVTMGPEAIPEYVHWYSPALRSRAEEKLNELQNTIQTIDGAMKQSTFVGGLPEDQKPSVQQTDQALGFKPVGK